MVVGRLGSVESAVLSLEAVMGEEALLEGKFEFRLCEFRVWAICIFDFLCWFGLVNLFKLVQSADSARVLLPLVLHYGLHLGRYCHGEFSQ